MPSPPSAHGHEVEEVEDEDDGDDEDDEDNDDDLKDEGNGHQAVVGASGGYAVEAECEFDADEDRTDCEFPGVAPDEASDIDRVTVPAEVVWAEVLDILTARLM